MEFVAKKFSDLTVYELYEILKSRTEVFLLEQMVICQDMDDLDQESLHCFILDKGRAVACLRAFRTDNDTARVSRVVTITHGKGLGRELMEKSIPEIKKYFGCKKVYAHAQKQAEGFYEKMGFKTVSGEYLEEGIIHVNMEMYI